MGQGLRLMRHVPRLMERTVYSFADAAFLWSCIT